MKIGSYFMRRQSGKPTTPRPVLALSGDVDMLPGVDTSFFRKAAQAIADMVPHGKFQLLTGQNHDVKTEAIAPVLSEFYGSG